MNVEVIDLLSSDEEEGDKTKNAPPVAKLTPTVSISVIRSNVKSSEHPPKSVTVSPGTKITSYFSPKGSKTEKKKEEIRLPSGITSFLVPNKPKTEESPEIIIEEVTDETKITFGPTITPTVIPRTPVADKKDDGVPKILSVLSLKRSASGSGKELEAKKKKKLHLSPPIEQVEKSNLPTSEVAFEEFRTECRKLPTSRPLSPVIQKLCQRFNNCDSKFRDSEQTVQLIQRTTYNIARHPDNPWSYMKTLSDELSAHKKGKAVKRLQLEKNKGLESVVEEEVEKEDGMDERTRKRLKKLYLNQKRLEKRIKELEKEEVNWSDESDSTYLKEDLYKRRLMQNYRMINELTKNSSIKNVKPKIIFHGSKYPAVNEAVEKMVNCLNRKDKFPNFDDMCKIVKEASQKMGLSKIEIEQIARDALPVVGKQMQRHRCNELRCNLGALLTDDVTDPAERDPDLERKLEENKKDYEKRESELLALFVAKQKQEKENPETEASKTVSPSSSKAASRASSPASHPASAASRSPTRRSRSASPSRSTKSDSRKCRSVSPSNHTAGPSSRSDDRSRSASRSAGPSSRSSSPAMSDTSSTESHISEDSRCDENSLHGSDSDMEDSDTDEENGVEAVSDVEMKDDETKQKERAMGPVSPPSVYSSSQNTPDMDEPAPAAATKPQSFTDAYLKHVASHSSQEPELLDEDSSEALEDLEEKITALSSCKVAPTEKPPSKSFAEVFKQHVSSRSQDSIEALSDSNDAPVKVLKHHVSSHSQDSVEALSDSNDAPVIKSEPKFNTPVATPNKDSSCPKKTQTARKSFTKHTPPMQTPEVTSSSQIDDDDDCITLSD